MGPYELGGDWSDKGIAGTDRFVQRSYELFSRFPKLLLNTKAEDKFKIDSLNNEEKIVYRKINQTIQKFDEEINNFRFNTAIASLMELINELTKNIENCSNEVIAYSLLRFGVLLAPIAPHLAEECLEIIGNESSVFLNPFWFDPDPAALIEDRVNIAVQINGKLRTTIEMPFDSEQSAAKKVVFDDEKIVKNIEGKTVVKEIFVKNKIYNIVVK
jgi:leucyl-tRNA synthetase